MKKQIMITGGLGNQMFQYALYVSLKNHGINCQPNASLYRDIKIHQGYELQKVFGISDVKQSSPKLTRLWYQALQKYHPSSLVCKDAVIVYQNKVYTTKAKYYFGFWMNEAYFKDYEDQIRRVFTFQNIDDRNLVMAAQMRKENSVSLHIRRGDYLKNPIYHVCTETYYRKAIEYLMDSMDAPIFYVFSDNPEWCEEFMQSFHVKYSVVNHNKGENSFKDMYLMTQCRHNIMANSTFSWWGAWLNDKPDKIVIAPSPWWTSNDKSPVCDNWVKIDGKGE